MFADFFFCILHTFTSLWMCAVHCPIEMHKFDWVLYTDLHLCVASIVLSSIKYLILSLIPSFCQSLYISILLHHHFREPI